MILNFQKINTIFFYDWINCDANDFKYLNDKQIIVKALDKVSENEEEENDKP